jgi:hypothetical protein
MHYLELAHEAQLHREAYIALLDGLLQTTAAKRHFAQSVGITPQYLSYLLNPFDRTPSPEVAHKMIDALPLDAVERDTLLEHLLLASERRLQAHLAAQQAFSPVDVATHMALLQQAHAAANFAARPEQARAQQQLIQETGILLLQQMHPLHHPLDYAQLCLWLHSVESACNLHANAIYHAKKARAVLSHFTRTDFSAAERDLFTDLTFNALRLEAVTYYNLKVARPAYDLCCLGETLPAVQQQPQSWLPHLYRDKLNAYSRLPRFSIRDAEQWAHHGKQLCEQVAHDEAPLWAVMLDRALAQAYLRYGNGKKALALLQPLVEELQRLPVAGVLHHVSVLRIYAEALWQAGDQQQWASVLATTWQLADSAGLTHQLAEIRRRYGDELTVALKQ